MKTMQGFWSKMIFVAAVFVLLFSLAVNMGCTTATSTAFLVGEWESQDANNQYRMQVSFNEKEKKYEGVLKQQGQLSQAVGFKLGEICWTATLSDNQKISKVEQKWRWGANGVSTGYEWRPDPLNWEKSSENKIVTATGRIFIRVTK